MVCCRPVLAKRLVSPAEWLLDAASAVSLFADDVVASSSVVRKVVVVVFFVCFSCVCSTLVVVVVVVAAAAASAANVAVSQELMCKRENDILTAYRLLVE